MEGRERRERRVVVTGYGAVSPGARDAREFWNNLVEGRPAISSYHPGWKRLVDTEVAGQAPPIDGDALFGRRFARKCDRFSLLALAAIREALQMSGGVLEALGPSAVGVVVGNNSGGWRSAQEGLQVLHGRGPHEVSPFLASNWFPAAPQGHASLQFGIRGYSKTIAADMASGNVAIGHAYSMLKRGMLKAAVCGGTENLVVDWGFVFYGTSNMLCRNSREPNGFKPFAADRAGMVLGDAAAFLVLETEESAIARGARILGEVVGHAMTFDGARNVARSQRVVAHGRCIQMATRGQRPDVVYLNGTATAEDDVEADGIRWAYPARGRSPLLCTCPKAFYGHTFGAAAGLDVITALNGFEKNVVIKTGHVSRPNDSLGAGLVTMDHALVKTASAVVVSRGMGGINSALYVKAAA